MIVKTTDEYSTSAPDRNRDALRWAAIIGEFAIIYILFIASIYFNIPRHNYLRFLVMIPLYHAGALFGYTGGFIAAMISLFLFVPVIPLQSKDRLVIFDTYTQISTLVFYSFFGIVMGAVGAARKSRMYVATLSNIFLSIHGESDERSVIVRACREAAALTESSGGAALVRVEGESDPARWSLIDISIRADAIEVTGGLPENNVLTICAKRNIDIRTNSATRDPGIALGPDAESLKSFVATPVAFDDKVYGALLLLERSNGENFTEKDLSIIKAIAETAGGAIHNMAHEKELHEEKLREEQMRELFSKYVSSSALDYELENADSQDGGWRDTTILVSDIRDFTTMSEEIPARALVSQLNEYFTAIVDVIFDHKGAIDKFIGDCVIAYWGAPAPDPDRGDNAVRAAAAMSRALSELNASWASRGMPGLSSGISIHSGKALIGNLGDERKKTFSIMGEEVDRAIDMESLTRDLGRKIVISERALAESSFGEIFEELEGVPAEYGKLFSLKTEPL